MVPGNCDDYTFGVVATPTKGNTAGFATEHILEFQMIKQFIQEMNSNEFSDDAFVDPTDNTKRVSFCRYIKTYYFNSKIKVVATPTNPNGPINTPLFWITNAYPGKNQNAAEFVLLEKGVNTAKEGMWGETPYVRQDTMQGWIDDINNVARAIQAVKDMYLAYEYHKIAAVGNTLRTQRLRVANAWNAMDAQVLPPFPMPFIITRQPSLGTYAPYISQSLEQRWLTWSRGKADTSRTRAETFMDTNARLLRDKWYVPAVDKPGLQTSDPVRYALIERIEVLSATVGARTAWANPF